MWSTRVLHSLQQTQTLTHSCQHYLELMFTLKALRPSPPRGSFPSRCLKLCFKQSWHRNHISATNVRRRNMLIYYIYIYTHTKFLCPCQCAVFKYTLGLPSALRFQALARFQHIRFMSFFVVDWKWKCIIASTNL